jgi:transposase
VAVDALGLIRAAVVTPASARDRGGGREATPRAKLAAPGLRRVSADSAYVACRFWAAQSARVILLVVREPPGPGSTVQPKRWAVERTFAWLGRRRRLLRGHERTAASTEAFVTAAMTGLMVRRLKPSKHS